MSRVKLFQLSENVQAVAVKDQSPNDKPCIKVTIYTDAHGAFMDFAFTSEHDTEELRDTNFDEDHTQQLIRIFNKVNIQSGLELEAIPEKPVEVKEPKKAE